MKIKKLILLGLVFFSMTSVTACNKIKEGEDPGKSEVLPDDPSQGKDVLHTVTFNSNGGTEVQSVEVKKDAKVTKPSNPTKEGYEFAGWYLNDTEYDFNTAVDTNITLVAHWTEVVTPVTKFTVTFNSNGGSEVQSVEVNKNEKVAKPADPTRKDCTFEGWYYNGALFNFDRQIEKSITLVASWKAEDKVSTYGFGEGLTAWTELEAEVGTKPVQNKDKTKTYNALAGEVSLYDITFESNSNNRVEADGKSYNTQNATITIELKSNAKLNLVGTWGSDTAGKLSIKEDSKAVYSSETLNKNDEFNVEKELEAGTYTISSDKSIKISTLKVERVVNYCTVSYVSEHGYNPVATIVEKNDKLKELPTLTEQGFVFEGWYTDSSFNTSFDSSKGITENVTLYAKWKVYNADDYAIISYVITPSTQEITDSTVEKNKPVSSLPILNNLNGYRFDGWYLDDTFETKFNQSEAIKGDLTLFAKFVKQITVTYVYEDTTDIAVLTFDADKALSYYPSVKSIYGKKFVGWKLDSQLFDKNTVVKSDLTLVAAYEDVDTSAGVAVLSSNGYEEGLYAEFMEFNLASSYNAYVKAGNGSYQKLDSQLIRKYKDGNNTYIRVDAVGLKAGVYSLKITPVVDGTEYDTAKAEVDNLVVSAHDRSGFGFVNGSSSGAYNDDGTLKANARVIYVSNSNKDTVETTAIESKQTVTKKGIQNIITAMKSQKGISDPVCIRILGNITDPQVLNKGDLYVDSVKNLTIEGIGTDATINGFGIVTKNSSCVEIRNLGFMNCDSNEGDDCGLQQKNDHIWVHNCDFFYGGAGSDADQAKGDGALDTKTSSYITHSYNHFYDNGKCNLQGMKSESTENYITYHHNWYDHSDSRHPRVRTCTVHVYNNYFDGNAKYGIASALGASIFAENNYFRSTTNTIPFMSGKMAHDIKDDGDNVLSGEAGGVIKEYGNVFEGDKIRYTKYQDNNASFDAYEASSRDEVVPSSVKPASGVAYNNFDTNSSIMYQYTVQSAEDAKNTVIAHAGRVQGGDFKWTFTAADDASDTVDTALKSALVSYSSKLVSVQGIDGSSSTTPEPTPTPVSPDDPDPTTPEVDLTNGHIKTFDNGVTDDFFAITANLKDGVAEKNYDNVKYKTAIKMESSSEIKFTITKTMTLTIITDTASKNIKIDGKNQKTNADGVLVIELSAGSHIITKGDKLNVYALIIK